MSGFAVGWAKGQIAPSVTAKAVLVALADYADQDGVAWPAVARLATEVQVSERTAQRAIRALEEAGLVKREPTTRGDGGQTSNRYRLALPPCQSDTPPVSICQGEGVAIVTPPVTTVSPPYELPLEPKASDEAFAHDSDGFCAWWEVYPRKVGKGRARKAYVSALKKVSAEILLNTLTAYRFGDDPKFIPHPATWLNDERWTDEAAAPAIAPSRRQDADPWPKRLRAYRLNGYWHSDWGAKPGKLGCLAPDEALMSAGYLPPPKLENAA